MDETVQPKASDAGGQEDRSYPEDLPDSLEDLKAVVTSRRIEFPERLRQIGMFAFQQPHQMAFMSVNEIAKVTRTSPSSVNRFARTLGFADYGSLRRVFQKHIAGLAREDNS